MLNPAYDAKRSMWFIIVEGECYWFNTIEEYQHWLAGLILG